MTQPEIFDLLSEAISDVGYCSYWSRDKDIFQAEFCNAQIYSVAEPPNGVPPSTIAVAIKSPSTLAFFGKTEADLLPPDKMEDELGAGGYRLYIGTDPAQAKTAVEELTKVRTLAGSWPPSSKEPNYWLAFAGETRGFVVSGQLIRVRDANAKEIPLEEIADRNRAWWDYWKEYWKRRESKSPMLEDWACEATIPMKE